MLTPPKSELLCSEEESEPSETETDKRKENDNTPGAERSKTDKLNLVKGIYIKNVLM